MFKYYENDKELSDSTVYYLVLEWGTAILDDLDSKEFSNCCEAVLSHRTHYRHVIPTCSKCSKDIPNDERGVR